MKYFIKIGLLVFAGAILGPGSALAQDDTKSAFERDHNVSVKERPRPEYETEGIRSGAFIYRPELGVTAEYNNNIFATDQDTTSDVIAIFAPSVTVETDWNVHSIKVNAEVESRQYLDVSSESHTNFGLGAEGRLDIKRGSHLRAGASFQNGHEGRTAASSFSDTDELVSFDRSDVFVEIYREFGRTRLQAGATYRDLDYDDIARIDGTIIDLDYRDRDDLGFELRGDYAISPNKSVFARASYITQDYKETGTVSSFDQNGYALEVGADFDISDFIRGEVGVGFRKRDYSNATRSSFDGLRYSGQIEWFATPLITVNGNGSRTVLPSSIENSSAVVATQLGLSADYEWRRNIIFSAGSDYRDKDYRDITRTDESLSHFVNATYYMNRKVGVTAGVVQTNFDSDGQFSRSDFNETKIVVGVTLRL